MLLFAASAINGNRRDQRKQPGTDSAGRTKGPPVAATGPPRESWPWRYEDSEVESAQREDRCSVSVGSRGAGASVRRRGDE